MIFSKTCLNLFFVFAVLSECCLANPLTREEFIEAIKGSYVTEMGTFGTTTGDEAKLGEYICDNWKSILNEYESLSLIKLDSIHGLHHVMIALACEELSPFAYLDFLEEMLDFIEQRKLNKDALNYAPLLFLGRGRKDSFLEVNWAHPRVKEILERKIRFFSEVDPSVVENLQREAAGEFADNYMTDRDEKDPLPETLPGIKLIRPWGSLFKKYEQITGKQISSGPKSPDSLVTRTSDRNLPSYQARIQSMAHLDRWSAWTWAAIVGTIFSIMLVARKLFRAGKRR